MRRAKHRRRVDSGRKGGGGADGKREREGRIKRWRARREDKRDGERGRDGDGNACALPHS